MVYLILAIGACAASTAAVLIRLCDAPPLVIAAFRMGIASCLVLPFVLGRHLGQLRALPARSVRDLLLSGVFLGFHFAFWISSLSHTSVASAVLLVSTTPVFVGIVGRLFLGEAIHARMALGTAVSLVGTSIVAVGDWGQGRHGISGDLLALGGAAAASGYFLIGRRQRQTLGLIPYIGVVYTAAALVLVLLALAAGHGFGGYGGRTYLLFVLLALGPQLLGHSSFNYALRRVPPAFIALVLLAEPIGSSALAYAFLGETPGPAIYAGAAVILTGIALAAWPRGRKEA